MFKKPLADLKTSATLKNSDRKKLRQRVLHEYAESTEVGDLLVPDGLQSVKFTTSGGEPGLAYLSAEGEPLWFSLGKGNNDLIPTVYTLWKKPRLLPYLSTPSAVIPVLQNGADLMAAGVVEMLGTPTEGQLVSVTQYVPGAVGPPLAVGRMAMPGARVREEDAKGKAVRILHVYKDRLWEMGGKGEPPEPELRPVLEDREAEEGEREGADSEEKGNADGEKSEKASHDVEAATPPPASEVEEADIVEEDAAPPPLDPQGKNVSSILRSSLIQAIKTTLSSLPQASFPIPSTTLYTQHILPSRPAHLASVSNANSSYTSSTSTTPIDIKHSASKNLTSFLRLAEKEGLLKLKEQRGKGGSGADVQVVSVNSEHADVKAHRVYRTIGEVEAKREKREAKDAARPKEIGVTELWKPHQQSIRLFEVLGKEYVLSRIHSISLRIYAHVLTIHQLCLSSLLDSSTALYARQQLKETLNTYITQHSLVNPNQQQFINIDALLAGVLASKGGGGGSADVPEFLRRDELLKRLVEKMQAWHKVELDGKDPILKKGKLHPIQITTKLRQGRKACTLLTQFEPFQLSADVLAEELRKICASSTSVNPLPGSNAGLEVMVQGKQIPSVRDLLLSKGVPKAWIEESDLISGKKK
ncbi:hypothetical protein A7U60_g6985 [Sanghuangporus baumii]|uniref:SUI1 domain-containing protein n=1 Tax=Sanghuangporus baumii TaxID=108892 RepID=A0A9Q5HTV4_SANBA|nr:hypothetical protein A7U60_g6985 [Sanghuangporus baumii]